MYSPQDLEDFLEMRGSVRFELRDEHGVLKEERFVDNLVVTVGKTHIATRMVGTTQAVMGWIEVGTNNTAPAAGDTTLNTAVGGSRTAMSSYSNAGAVVTAVATLGAGVGTGALVEAGIFNASSAGTMLCRTIFSVINKAAGDSLTITWTVTVG